MDSCPHSEFVPSQSCQSVASYQECGSRSNSRQAWHREIASMSNGDAGSERAASFELTPTKLKWLCTNDGAKIIHQAAPGAAKVCRAW